MPSGQETDWAYSTVCLEKSEPPKHFALTSANMPRIEQN